MSLRLRQTYGKGNSNNFRVPMRSQRTGANRLENARKTVLKDLRGWSADGKVACVPFLIFPRRLIVPN